MIKRLMLNRLRKKFIYLVERYMAREGYNQTTLAKYIGIQRTHLNNLLNENNDRQLTAYYIQKFLQKGVFSVKDIYDGNPESEKEADFWKQASESNNWELLKFISKVREQKKVDVLSVLKSIYPDVD